MSGYSPSFDSEARFLEWIDERIRSQAARSFVVPLLDANPPTTDPTNMWVLTDGRLRVRWWDGSAWQVREFTPVAPTSPTPPAPPSPGPSPTTRSKIWTATWSQSYRSSGAPRTDQGTKFMYYGSSGDSFNGRNRSLAGFDYADIVSSLSGSTVKRVQLKMTNIHAYNDSGVDVYFGIHNSTSEPASWPSIVRSKISKQHFGKPQTRTVDLPLEFATRIRDGSGKGIAIEAPDSAQAHYGYAAGVGSGYTPPQLIVTYVK